MNLIEVSTALLTFSFLIGVLKTATPLLFAALGGLFSERSGTIQIALEGFMLIGALFASIGALATGSAWIGFFCGSIAAGLFSILFAFFILFLKTDQIITGMAFNILALGLAPFITKILYGSTGSAPSLGILSRFTVEPMMISILLAGLIYYFFYFTKAGLIFRFSGESGQVLQAAGVSVVKVRFLSLIITGLLSGMGGASLSLMLASSYSPGMTAGRGFIALAALILGRWNPLGTAVACFFFAFIDAIQITLQSPLNAAGVPLQLIQAFPYIVTILILAGLFGKNQAPAELGKT